MNFMYFVLFVIDFPNEGKERYISSWCNHEHTFINFCNLRQSQNVQKI